jgi:Aldo/keto reductase family
LANFSQCGGFLAEKWLGQPEPETFDEKLTPSHRKVSISNTPYWISTKTCQYLEMINIWGGWDLFQALLHILSEIAEKHNVTIPLVATRWVLDHECVGAVIVGVRLGVSEHAEENLKVFGWSLDSDDLEAIAQVQEKSRRKEIFKTLGDCGAEYRQ